MSRRVSGVHAERSSSRARADAGRVSAAPGAGKSAGGGPAPPRHGFHRIAVRAREELDPGAPVAGHPGSRPARVSPFARRAMDVPGSGHSLSPELRGPAEAATGVDLSAVRVHHDARSGAAAANLGARAFTRGAHVFFAPERYRPDTQAGRRLLDHELAHAADALRDPGAGRPPTVERFPNRLQAGTVDDYLAIVRTVEAANPTLGQRAMLTALATHVKARHRGLTGFRYFETTRYGWIDIVHFTEAADMAASYGEAVTDVLGFGNEVFQWAMEWGGSYRSGFSSEDIPSNSAGSNFGDDEFDPNGAGLSAQLQTYLTTLGPVAPSASTTLAGLPARDVSGAPGSSSSSSSGGQPAAASSSSGGKPAATSSSGGGQPAATSSSSSR